MLVLMLMQEAAEAAGKAVSAVSGDQILKAIVDAAETTGGKKAAEAKDAVEAAIGAAGDGAANAGGANAGKLFASGNAHAGANADAQGAAEAAGKAVSAVSGDQILKAIVDAAETTGGKGTATAKDAVEAAIGDDGANAAGAAFAAGMQNKNDQIAAAIVLRGLAKDGKFANANAANGNTKVVAAKKASGWIKEMHKAVEDTAKAGTGGGESIANVATGGGDNAGAGKKADAGSVTGIAKGMKAIVAAAGKAGVELKPAAAGGGDGAANAGANAGRLFASGNNAGNAGNAGDANAAQGAAEAAGKAVSAVSGDQILKAIVDAAETTAGKGAAAATNAVEAAIGAAGDGAEGAAFAAGIAGKNDQIAAAIVLRGLAKDGKFANANNAANTKVVAAKKAVGWIKEMHKAVEDTAKAGDGSSSESIANVADGGNAAGAGKKADAGSVTGIAKGMKAIVDAAEKAGVELKPAAAAGAGGDGGAAGRLFASGNAHAGNDAQGAAEAAGKAVSAVSGDQILKAIVDAAGTTAGKGAAAATNAVEAAIGAAGDGAAAFAGDGMQDKNDQIAAAIVLRGLAKDGKFANANDNANENGNTKVVASKKASGWIKEMHKAVEDTAKAGAGSGESIANVADGGDAAAGKKADEGSVTGIAKGMKAIVAAAGKAGVELKPAAAGGAGGANDAGRLFASGNAHAGANAQGAAEAAGKAVSAVSGDQILKAIVDAAETTGGKGATEATNAVEAAIGDDGGAAAAFANAGMQNKNDQIAAAIVLRGLAKDGKFANANDNANTKVVASKKASGWIKEMHKAVEDTAKAGTGSSSESIANVADGGAGAGNASGKKADAGSVTGIAKGMKAIVDAAEKAGVEFKPAAAGGAGGDGGAAGRLFASGNNAHAGDNAADAQGAAEAAGKAVSAVSGDQILKAIVDAAGTTGVEFKPAAAGGAGGANDAGKLFASGAAGNAGDAQGAAEAAGKAVSAVSGDQILKAIVDAAETTGGKKADTAKDAVEAAIGADADDGAGAAFAAGGGIAGKNDQIAAAIVLRGLAKDGKFANENDAANGKVVASKKASGWIKEIHKAVEDTAKAGDGGSESIANVAAGGAGAGNASGKKADAGSVTGIAKGMKAIVATAGKAGVELKAGAGAGAGAGANDAGKLFASGNAHAGDAGAAQGAAEAAGKAVSAVSGDQILKAIVDAAETTGGKGAAAAKDAVEAAIGDDGANAAGAAFAAGIAGKNDQIAAAIVLRGLAKDGKFANENNANTKVVASKKAVGWIKEMHKAVEDTAKAGTGSGESIANVATGGGNAGAGAGKGADKDSVTGIAKGMKAIVAAAGKAGVEFKPDPAAAGAGAGGAAGRLFASGAAGAADNAQGAAEAAGKAVSAVSGDQILKAIVDAAETTGGARADTAKDAVEAAIGADDGAGAAFGAGMQNKNDQIAAAIVLRGLAKDGKFANANDNANGKVEASKKAVGWIKEMHKAVEDTAKAGTGSSSESIANVATGGDGNASGKGADVGSVTGIAKGMKAIVDAAEKAGVEFKPAAAAGAGGANDAGKLFASGNNAHAGDNAQEAAEAAGKAVSAVSGDQILKAIVDAARTTAGKGAATATNAVEAAIGADDGAEGAAFAAGGGIAGKNDQIAAAIVLRGLAKDGKFANENNAANTKVVASKKAVGWIKEMHKAVEDTAKAGTGSSSESIANVADGGDAAAGNGAKADAGSVTGIAKGMKAIVDAAGKAGVEFKPDPAAGAGAGAANAGANAGKLFASGNAGNAGAAQGAAEAAGKAVSAVSGDQILKAIVDAAGSTGGKGADTATNAVEAAIGADDGAGAAFGAGMQNKNDQIAAAIVLRGLAKDGKFANENNANTKVVASKKASGWIKEMHKAVEDTAKAGDGGSESIANVAAGGNNAGAGKKADKDSVTGIAKGMKAIVAAAGKAGVELKPAAGAGAGAANAGANAGKLFASGNNAHAGADANAQGAAEAAGKAVSAVSGDQILKAIVDAAESTAGARANTAKDAVEAAIGADDGAEGAAFAGGMQNKNDQIAAAIVLRGLAKDGKFANENNANTKVVASKKASGWIKEMHKAVEDTAKAGTGSGESIANVAAGGAGAGAGKKADKDSVTGIAKGMKAIVAAAGKAGVEFKPDPAAAGAGAGGANDAGKLFASGNNAHAGDNAGDNAQGAAEAAGKAVSAVSGDQILKAIVDAAGTTAGKKAAEAKDAVEAAIGGDDAAAAFAGGGIAGKNDQIAAAIVLRGLAKDGKFANANAANTKVVAAVKHMHRATEDTINAADFNTFYVFKIVIT